MRIVQASAVAAFVFGCGLAGRDIALSLDGRTVVASLLARKEGSFPERTYAYRDSTDTWRLVTDCARGAPKVRYLRAAPALAKLDRGGVGFTIGVGLLIAFVGVFVAIRPLPGL